jgi:excisionase family DNA binding protein
MTPTSDFLNLKEAAAYARLSVQTLKRLEQAGRVRFLKPSPRRLIVDRAELDKYLRGTVKD